MELMKKKTETFAGPTTAVIPDKTTLIISSSFCSQKKKRKGKNQNKLVGKLQSKNQTNKKSVQAQR